MDKQPSDLKPRLIFDGDCHFCGRWVACWEEMTGDSVDYQPYQRVGSRYPQIPREDFEKSVQLVDPDGKVYSGAEAVFRVLNRAPGNGHWLWLYQHVPGVRFLSELFYRLVANHRILFSFLTRFFWGEDLAPSRYFLTRHLFLKGLALIYLIAFLSIGSQIIGLVGEKGVLPANLFLNAVKAQIGPERYHLLPTLFWVNASDAFLRGVCLTGTVASVLLLVGFFPQFLLTLLCFLYLSVSVIGRDFMSFQWDVLLIETGFLAIFFAPSGFFPGKKQTAPPRGILFLLRWLLFRLMFWSGVVKFSSHDQVWRDLTALQYHYQTQPLPIWTSWYAQQLPEWFQRVSVAGVFGMELVIPFLIFAPKRIRSWGAWTLISFQLLILSTGNYCFFNLLAILLCFLLFDDLSWPRVLRLQFGTFTAKPLALPGKILRGSLHAVLAVFVLGISIYQFPRVFRTHVDWPEPMTRFYKWTAPFRLVNSYGLFAVMTTERGEIIIEGSNDGKEWLPYEFKHKPGDLGRRPGLVAPYQPRLDWQMWFAALSNPQDEPWFVNLCLRLLTGSADVLRLLDKNPFPKVPPRYLRASFYDYRFTTPEERAKTGQWWERTYKGTYLPAISLKNKPPQS